MNSLNDNVLNGSDVLPPQKDVIETKMFVVTSLHTVSHLCSSCEIDFLFCIELEYLDFQT